MTILDVMFAISIGILVGFITIIAIIALVLLVSRMKGLE